MPKSIKQKEKQSHSIRKLDKNVQFTSRIKRTMIDHYRENKEDDKNDKEKSNVTNYATSKLMRVGNRGARETAYAITGVSKKVYNKAKMKLVEQRLRRKDNVRNNNEITNLIKTSDTHKATNVSVDTMSLKNYYQRNNKRFIKVNNFKIKDANIVDNQQNKVKDLQRKMLIKDRQSFKDIKEHTYKDNGIKQNNNTLKIKTRESSTIHNVYDNSKSQMQSKNANSLMKKSSLQKTKEKAHSLKEKGKKVGKAVVNGGKKLAKSVKGIGVLLGAGGGFVLLLIVIIIMIAGIFKSMFGIFFTNDTAKSDINNISVGTAITRLEEQVDDEIEEIKDKTNYDSIRIENRNVAFKEILSIYSVITTNRENKFDITQMNEQNYEKLSEIFWNVVEVEHYTENYTVKVVTTDADGNKVTKTKTKTRLIINVKVLSLEDMMKHYNMSNSEKKQVKEMMNEEFDEMWNLILSEDI